MWQGLTFLRLACEIVWRLPLASILGRGGLSMRTTSTALSATLPPAIGGSSATTGCASPRPGSTSSPAGAHPSTVGRCLGSKSHDRNPNTQPHSAHCTGTSPNSGYESRFLRISRWVPTGSPTPPVAAPGTVWSNAGSSSDSNSTRPHAETPTNAISWAETKPAANRRPCRPCSKSASTDTAPDLSTTAARAPHGRLLRNRRDLHLFTGMTP